VKEKEKLEALLDLQVQVKAWVALEKDKITVQAEFLADVSQGSGISSLMQSTLNSLTPCFNDAVKTLTGAEVK